MFTIEFEKNGLIEKLQTAALVAEDLETVFYKMGAYLAKKAKAKYEAQNFAPLAASTQRHRATQGLKRAERKLAKDVGRALKREKISRMPKGIVARAMASLGVETQTIHERTRGVSIAASKLSEFRKSHTRIKDFIKESGLVASNIGALKALTLKQKIKLNTRVASVVAKAIDGPILGRLNRSPVFEVGEDSVTLISRTYKEFSDVHNKGGTAGHGASIPARTTIELDDEDIVFLQKLLVEHCMAPLVEE